MHTSLTPKNTTTASQQQQIEHVTEYHYNFTSDYLPPNIMVLISNCKMAIKQHNFILL